MSCFLLNSLVGHTRSKIKNLVFIEIPQSGRLYLCIVVSLGISPSVVSFIFFSAPYGERIVPLKTGSSLS